jgi:hypothetical protein
MKLNVLERINLMGILPAESNYITFRILTDLKKALSFTEKEIKEFKIEQKEGRVFWSKSKYVEIPIGEQANVIIQTALKKVDSENKVNEGNFSLFVKFPFEEEKK